MERNFVPCCETPTPSRDLGAIATCRSATGPEHASASHTPNAPRLNPISATTANSSRTLARSALILLGSHSRSASSWGHITSAFRARRPARSAAGRPNFATSMSSLPRSPMPCSQTIAGVRAKAGPCLNSRQRKPPARDLAIGDFMRSEAQDTTRRRQSAPGRWHEARCGGSPDAICCAPSPAAGAVQCNLGILPRHNWAKAPGRARERRWLCRSPAQPTTRAQP
jgi:hypothetical protein